MTLKLLPTFYVSHGAPTLVIETRSKTYKFLQLLGTRIYSDLRPSAIVIFSGHWETSGTVSVTEFSKENPIIYDFYGFPAVMYKQEFRSPGDPHLSERVVDLLKKAGIDATKDPRRGLDHGAWVPLKIGFPNPCPIPVVQVSLLRNATFEEHVKVGRALAPLRSENVLIIGSGSMVHNIPEGIRLYLNKPSPPYVEQFDRAVEGVFKGHSGKSLVKELVNTVRTSPVLNKAHPSYEHLAPLFVTAGAAAETDERSVHGKKIHEEYWSAFSLSAIEFDNDTLVGNLKDEL